jgi:hypothetical protein
MSGRFPAVAQEQESARALVTGSAPDRELVKLSMEVSARK